MRTVSEGRSQILDSGDLIIEETKQTKNQNCFKKLKGQKTPQKSKQSNKFIDLDQFEEKTLGMGTHIPAFMVRSSNNKDD